MEPVNLNDLETSEEDLFQEVTYQGKPFTGVATEWDNGVYTEYRYQNGAGHGRCFSRWESGQLQEEFWLDGGKLLKETTWYPTGVVRSRYQADPQCIQYFTEAGVLYYERTARGWQKWYPSGERKEQAVLGGRCTYYGKDGVWAAECLANPQFGGFGFQREQMRFHDAYLQEHYLELLEDEDFFPYFVSWLPEPKKETRRLFWRRRAKPATPPEVVERVGRMIDADHLAIKMNGILLATRYQAKELIPQLERALTCHRTPPATFDVATGTGQSYGRTVAEQAKRVLAELQG